MRTRCPVCLRLWYRTPQGDGCLTRNCPHTMLGRDKDTTKRRPKKEKA